ncbi:MAG: patatin-like phospholipase family protein, partial [Proteobacteria bacterium]|nr:patatin-like phospholipase family protein [Pseudomonadota bacterium]
GILFVMCLFLLGACATVHPNPKLEEEIDLVEVSNRKLNPPDRSDEVFFIMTLSGGGTRAAAMAYGVMEALNQVEIPVAAISTGASASRPLLKEVDMISSVSGGSFTSAYYGLYEDRLFDDFKDRFLYRNVQSALIWRILNPFNWGKFLTTGFGRSNLAADYYDKILFDDATFGDMLGNDGPMVMIQATDIIDGYTFTFTPYFFSMICSDLREIPVSFAVTASSSFPGAFNGMSLYNYGGTCGNKSPAWVHDAFAKNDPLDISYQLAKRDLAYRDSETKKYVHLYDGGVSDNLGLRSPFQSLVQLGKTKEFEKLGLGNTKRVVFVIVNAQISKSKDNVFLSHLPNTPRTGRSLGSAMTTIMNSGNFDTLFIFKEYLKRAQEKGSLTEIYPIHLAFENLKDPEERQFFENVSTALALPEETVDKLIEVSGRLLYKNKEFLRLVKDLGGTIRDKKAMTGKTDSELLETLK